MCTSASTSQRIATTPTMALACATFLVLACDDRSRTTDSDGVAATVGDVRPKAEVPGSTRLSCPAADSASGEATFVFSDVIVSDETGDASGFEISLMRSDSSWSGSSREATGEFGPWQPLVDFELRPASRSIRYAIPNGADSSRFAGQFDCDSLWGQFKAYRTTPGRAVTYRRVTERSR